MYLQNRWAAQGPGRRLLVLLGGLLALWFLILALCWVGYLGSDDAIYVDGALGWLNHFPYVGGHGSIRHTLTIPIALSFAAFGQHEYALVLPSLLYGLALVAGVGWFVAQRAGTLAALVGMAAILFMPGFVALASIASIDLVEACLVFASLVVFCHACGRPEASAAPVVSGVLAGLAFLSRETTVFLLAFYGVLFVLNYGGSRRRYFVMAAGFFAVWGLELVYLTALTGDPLYRVALSINHGEVDRIIMDAGNLRLHPLVDPFLVVLFNQEFGALFWIGGPAGLFLALWPHGDGPIRTLARMFTGLAVVWFGCASILYTLLPLNPRYYLVAAIALAVNTGLLFAYWAKAGRRGWALVAACVLFASYGAGLAAENWQFMYGERQLIKLAARAEGPLVTDPLTLRRAGHLLEWSGVGGQIVSRPPRSGDLVLVNDLRLRELSRSDDMAAAPFLPRPGLWRLVDRRAPPPKLLGRALEGAGLDWLVPPPLWRTVHQSHPGVSVWLVP